jgi:Undecaprenyl-phosphate galactose phosphotransferase WbaP
VSEWKNIVSQWFDQKKYPEVLKFNGKAATIEKTELQNSRLGMLIYETSNLPLLDIIRYCEMNYIPLYIVPSVNGLLSVPFHVLDQKSFLLFSTKTLMIDGLGSRIKRLTDILAAIFGLVIASWLFVILWILVRLTSPGPGFFAHERLGLNGRKIKIYKFRTMVKDADKRLEVLLQDEIFRKEWEVGFKLAKDPRATSLGRFLRKTSLDEIPQLFNVLRGDISLVGPRPIVPQELEKYGEQAKLILRVKPGLTGLWQVSGRNEVSYKERIRLDLHYIHNWSLRLDLQIILQTVLVVLGRKGAV